MSTNRSMAHQLTLVRDAISGNEPLDPTTRTSSVFLLSELIAANLVEVDVGSVGAEQSYLKQLDALAAQGRQIQDRPAKADEIDLGRLADFLNDSFPQESRIQVKSAHTVSRGMSKKTVLVQIEGACGLPPDLALRIDRTESSYIETSVVDEWGVLKLLWDNGARIPQPFALEPTGKVIGDRFLVSALARGAPVGSIFSPPSNNPALIAEVATCMAQVHSMPVDGWPVGGQPQGDAYFDAQYEEYLSAWQELGTTSAIVEAAFRWISENRHRAYGPPTVVHDDFNFNNMLVDQNRVTAVLDWEFAHIGTAAADVAYFWYAAQSASSFEAFLEAYEAAGGTRPPAEQLVFYRLWGQLRLVILAFKSVRMLEAGKFSDVRFGMARWHLRQGLLRVAELVEELGVA